jgi:hypothetical protein
MGNHLMPWYSIVVSLLKGEPSSLRKELSTSARWAIFSCTIVRLSVGERFAGSGLFEQDSNVLAATNATRWIRIATG